MSYNPWNLSEVSIEGVTDVPASVICDRIIARGLNATACEAYDDTIVAWISEFCGEVEPIDTLNEINPLLAPAQHIKVHSNRDAFRAARTAWKIYVLSEEPEMKNAIDAFEKIQSSEDILPLWEHVGKHPIAAMLAWAHVCDRLPRREMISAADKIANFLVPMITFGAAEELNV